MLDVDTTGQRVRFWRTRRGLTQRQLAGLAGVDQSYVSYIESGTKQVDRMSTLRAIADALRITVNELQGLPPDPAGHAAAATEPYIPAVRLALVHVEEGEPGPATWTAEQMDAALDNADRLRGTSDYATLIKLLPELLTEAAGHGGIRLSRAASNTSACLRNLGHRDLSRVASRIGLAAARDVDDPAWLGSARFFHALSLPVEAATVAQRMSDTTINDLQNAAGDPRARQMLGQAHLTAAHAASLANRPRDVAAHLQAARDEAATLGDPEDGAGFDLLCFGPTNISMWELTLATEMGDVEAAIRLGQKVQIGKLTVQNRHRAYWETMGKALSFAGGRDTEALAAFRRAELLSPAVFAVSPTVRDSLHAMVTRAKTRAVPAELRVLARRAGVTA